MEPQTGAAIAGAIVILANIVIFWVREWIKHKTWSKNGNDLKEIKTEVKDTNDKIACVDKKVGEAKVKIGEVKTAVDSQKAQCSSTIKRFDKAIGDQYQHIVDLAREKK